MNDKYVIHQFSLFILKGVKAFMRSAHAGIAPSIAILAIPMIGITGGTLDYGLAVYRKTQLQAQLDAAVLAGVQKRNATDTDGGFANAKMLADNQFANWASQFPSAQRPTADIVNPGDLSLKGEATFNVQTSFLSILGIKNLNVKVVSQAERGPQPIDIPGKIDFKVTGVAGAFWKEVSLMVQEPGKQPVEYARFTYEVNKTQIKKLGNSRDPKAIPQIPKIKDSSTVIGYKIEKEKYRGWGNTTAYIREGGSLVKKSITASTSDSTVATVTLPTTYSKIYLTMLVNTNKSCAPDESGRSGKDDDDDDTMECTHTKPVNLNSRRVKDPTMNEYSTDSPTESRHIKIDDVWQPNGVVAKVFDLFTCSKPGDPKTWHKHQWEDQPWDSSKGHASDPWQQQDFNFEVSVSDCKKNTNAELASVAKLVSHHP